MGPAMRNTDSGRAALWIVALAAAGVGVVLAYQGCAGGPSALLGSYTEPGEPSVIQTAAAAKEESTVIVAQQAPARPAIDVTAPAKTETATFALG